MSNEPLSIVSGDTVTWTESRPDYPAADWTLTYFIKQDSETPIPMIAVGSDDSHTVTLSAAVTATFLPGKYRLTGRVTSTTEAYTIYEGFLQVTPDPSKPYDARTHYEKGLVAIEAVLEGKLSDPIVDYEIDGLKVKNMSHKELVELHTFYKAAVRRQKGVPAIKGIPAYSIYGRR